MKLKAIIIEDEEESRNVLSRMIAKYCPNVLLLGAYETVAAAIEPIYAINPDIVFLDIELPNESGFALFDYIQNPTFGVIFTTAYNQFAIKAFKMSAIDYLLKPIDLEELKNAINKVEINSNTNSNQNLIELLKENILSPKKRIALSHSDGYDLLDMDDIMWIESDSNYIIIHMNKGKNLTAAKTLKNLEDILDKNSFFRINRGILVNIDFITQFKKNDNSIILIDNTNLPLSEARKEAFLAMYQKV